MWSILLVLAMVGQEQGNAPDFPFERHTAAEFPFERHYVVGAVLDDRRLTPWDYVILRAYADKRARAHQVIAPSEMEYARISILGDCYEYVNTKLGIKPLTTEERSKIIALVRAAMPSVKVQRVVQQTPSVTYPYMVANPVWIPPAPVPSFGMGAPGFCVGNT